MKIKLHQYISELNINPFEKWFNKLNPMAAAKIATALYRLEQGNFSNVEGVGEGVFEYKLNFGPGYRIYFGQDGDELIILVGGGTKKLQAKDIQNAKKHWSEYKALKKRI